MLLKVVVILTLCLSMARSIDALWNLARGLVGFMAMALLSVARATSDFFM